MVTQAEKIRFTETSSKTIAKNSIFLYIRMGIIMAFSLIGVRFLLKALGVENYGVYNAIGGVVTSFAFLSNVLAGASQRYFSYAIGQNDVAQLNRSFRTVILVYLTIISIIVILAETLGEWFIFSKMDFGTVEIGAIQMIFQFSLLTFITTLLSTPMLAMIISHEQMRYYSMISICDSVLKLSVIFLLFSWPLEEMRIEVYPVLLFSVSLLTFVFYFVTILRRFPYLNVRPVWDKSLFKEIFSYSGWSCFGSLANVLYNQGMNMLLNVFVGPLANSAFTVANQVNGATTTFGSSFFLAVRPSMVKSYAAKNSDRLRRLYIFSSKSTFALLFIFIEPLLLQTPTVLHLWLGELCDYMVPFTRILMVGSLIMSLGLPVTTIIQASGKIKLYHAVVDGFIAISILSVYIILKQHLSPLLAMGVSVPAYIVAHFLRLIILKKECGIGIKPYVKLFMLPAVAVICSSVLFVGGVQYWIHLSPIYELLVITFSSVVINVLLIYFILLNQEDRQRILSIIRKKQ